MFSLSTLLFPFACLLASFIYLKIVLFASFAFLRCLSMLKCYFCVEWQRYFSQNELRSISIHIHIHIYCSAHLEISSLLVHKHRQQRDGKRLSICAFPSLSSCVWPSVAMTFAALPDLVCIDVHIRWREKESRKEKRTILVHLDILEK